MRTAMIVLALVAIMGAGSAQARDTELNLDINDVMRDGEITSKLGKDVAFYFSGQSTPKVSKTLGDFVTNRKTNSFGKPDDKACRWAALAALIHLQERARQLGGNAVVNIVSYYKKSTSASDTDYVCHAGNFVAGVALKGTVAVVGR
jgi:uncharacterized protein YbjQ (UPF0145 family)